MSVAKSGFGPNAEKYLHSTVHKNPADLKRLEDLLQPKKSDVLLDIATGGGHVAYHFAPLVSQVIALDISPEMLLVVEREAQRLGLNVLVTRLGDAHNLPLPDESVSLVTNRVAAHHFRDKDLSSSEVYRVLKPGGKYAIMDTSVPNDPALDAEINEIELLRDPSHVRNSSPAEWRKLLETAGFTVPTVDYTEAESGMGVINLYDWMDRINTPVENREILVHRFQTASDALKRTLAIEPDGSDFQFKLPRVFILAIRS